MPSSYLVTTQHPGDTGKLPTARAGLVSAISPRSRPRHCMRDAWSDSFWHELHPPSGFNSMPCVKLPEDHPMQCSRAVRVHVCICPYYFRSTACVHQLCMDLRKLTGDYEVRLVVLLLFKQAPIRNKSSSSLFACTTWRQ